MIVGRLRKRHQDGRRRAADELGDRPRPGAGHNQISRRQQRGDIITERHEDRLDRLAGVRRQFAHLRAALPESGDTTDLDAFRRQACEAFPHPAVQRRSPLAAAKNDEHLLRRIEPEPEPRRLARDADDLAADRQSDMAHPSPLHPAHVHPRGQVQAPGEPSEKADRATGNPVGFVQGHGPAKKRRHDDDARSCEATEPQDDIGTPGPDHANAKPQRPRLFPETAAETRRAQCERRSRNPFEAKLRVFLDQARVHSLLADEEHGLVAAGVEPFRKRDARREMSARASAGDEKTAHRLPPSRPRPVVSAASSNPPVSWRRDALVAFPRACATGASRLQRTVCRTGPLSAGSIRARFTP